MEYKIKLATQLDNNKIIAKLREAHQDGPYKSKQSFNDARSLAVLNHIHHQGPQGGMVMVAEDTEGDIVGLFGAVVSYSSFSMDPLGVEMLWWVSPKARKSRLSITLVDGFEMWAKKLGLTKLVLGSMENEHSDAIDRFYKRRGYELTERTYFKELT